MAEASQKYTTLDTRKRLKLLKRIFGLILENSLVKIKRIFETLEPEQRIKILNSSMNGCIPLYESVSKGKIKISRYLLRLSLHQGSSEMLEIWKNCRHPLKAAVSVGNSKLIEMILEQLSDINENISGYHTPLLIAIFSDNLMAVELIVTMGADINRSCSFGKSPLMYSTYNSEICRFLIWEGANIFHEDEWGTTALHIAAKYNHTESVSHLVMAGADVRIRNHEGITPLIFSIRCGSQQVFRYLINKPAYSTLDTIEALELIGAFSKDSQASWSPALEFRRTKKLPKNCQAPALNILDFSKEFTTEKELQNLQKDPLHRTFQCILIVERIMGRNNRFYMRLLLQAVLIAKDVNMSKVRQLIDYIQEYCEDNSLIFVAANLVYSKKLLSAIGDYINPNDYFVYGGFDLFKLVAITTLKMWRQFKTGLYRNPFSVYGTYSNIVDTFLYLTSTTKTLNFSQQQVSLFRQVVEEIVGEDPRVRLLKSILHRAIKLFSNTSWCSVELIKILLESGADANSKDHFRQTPFLCALRYVPEDKLDAVKCLLFKYGGHPDCRSNEGFTATGDTPWGRRLSIGNKPLRLECLATGVILDNDIPYEGILSEEPEILVNLHK